MAVGICRACDQMVDLDDYERRLIGRLLEDIRKPVPRNLCPTFYRTLNYADECKLKEKADNITEKLGIAEDELYELENEPVSRNGEDK